MNKPAILCVDDEKDVLDTLFRVLGVFKSEYDIELAEAGEDALEIFSECNTDNVDIPLILADFLMPGMKGDELLIELHKKHPAMKKILLTGQATLEGVKNAYENANLYRYIAKPWEKQDLILTIEEALKSYYRDKSLEKAEKKYQRIFERAIEGMFQTTLDGSIIVVNSALSRIIGYDTPEELITSVDNVQKLYVNPDDRNYLIKNIQIKQGVVELETRIRKKDGSVIWAQLYTGPVINEEGEIEKIEGFLRDITEKKETQKRLDFLIKEREMYLRDLDNLVKERTQELEEKNRKILEINAELKRISTTDKLTGLYNRNKLDEVLENEHLRTLRYGYIYSLIIIDIDFFKSVNDTYGHQTGDEVLIEISKTLKNSIRKVDTAGRWGGEEFIIICPDTPQQGAISIAEKIRKKVERQILPVVNHKTISLGVASFKEGETIAEVIERADKNLYYAKNKGRNRVEYKQ